MKWLVQTEEIQYPFTRAEIRVVSVEECDTVEGAFAFMWTFLDQFEPTDPTRRRRIMRVGRGTLEVQQ